MLLNRRNPSCALRDLFDYQLFPGSDHIHTNPFPNNPELSYLRPTPYAEMFDVLLTSVPPDVLPSYRVVLLAGYIEFNDAFRGELEKTLRRGVRVLMSPRHRELLGAAECGRLAGQGEVELLEPWVNPVTKRATAISNDRLRRLMQQHLPVEISGDPIQYEINRVPKGWVVEMINNAGVIKKPGEVAITDRSAVARVRLKPRVKCESAVEWRSQRKHDKPDAVEMELGPGAVEFIEFTMAVE